MVLKVLAVTINALLPSNYYVHALVSILAIVVVHAFAQGRTTNRERDMHARVVLLTVRVPRLRHAFTSHADLVRADSLR